MPKSGKKYKTKSPYMYNKYPRDEIIRKLNVKIKKAKDFGEVFDNKESLAKAKGLEEALILLKAKAKIVK